MSNTWIKTSAALMLTLAYNTGHAADTQAPTVPAGLASTAVTINSVSLKWTASTDNVAVTGYDIYSGSTKLATVTTTTYTNTGLAAGTSYSYTVKAHDAAGNTSAASTALAVQTTADTTAPTTPSGLTKGAVTKTTASLSWTASTDNVGVALYDVYRNGTLVGNSTTTSFADTSLTAGTTYSYTVKAADAANNLSAASTALSIQTASVSAASGNLATVYYYNTSWASANIHYGINGTWTAVPGVAMSLACTGYWTSVVDMGTATSMAATFNLAGTTWDNNGGNNYTIGVGTTLVKNGVVTANAASPCVADTTAPTVPTALTQGTVTSTTATVSWTASTDNVGVVRYDVYRNGTLVGSSTTTSYSDSGLTASTAYSYTVLAADAAGNKSAQSAALSVTTAAAGASNTAIVYYYNSNNWTAVNIHYGIAGTWTVSPGVAMTLACTGYWTKTVSLGTATTMAADFDNGTTWDNNGGNNYTINTGTTIVKSGVVTSNAASPCAADTTAPTVPTALTKGTVTTTSVALSWTASTDNVGVVRYDVYRNGTLVGSSTTTSYSDTGLTAGTAYSYTVLAADAAGNKSAQSTALAVTTATADTTAPSVPAGLTQGTVTSTTAAFSWTASTDNVGVVRYDVYRNATLVGSSTTTSYSDSGLTAATAYSYTVLAADAAGNKSAQSTALSITTSAATGNTAVVYYYNSNNWTAVNIHYGINAVWTTPPGVAMTLACTGYWTKTVSLGTATTMAADFDNGTTWDNNGGNNYTIGVGTTIVKNGVVTANAAAPCVVDTTPPTAPSGLTASANGTVVSLAWTASTDNSGTIAHYTITRTGGAGSVTFTSSGNSYSDTSGAPFTSYSYSVTAADPSGNVSTPSASVAVTTGAQSVTTSTFSWRNATVYFAMTDRFVNGDTSNDRSYCRESDANCVPFSNDVTQAQATFHGGDLKGLTSKVNAGYFTDLGVNAIWISAPYEQIHGWVAGDGQKHYAYHGYYALDYTNMEANFGTAADLQALVDAAHAKGIRIVVDIVMNHSGYETLFDMNEYKFGTLNSGWQAHAYKTDFAADYATDIQPYIDTTNATTWAQWWSGSWMRSPKAGYPACGSDDLTTCTGGLPDFITESTAAVSLAPLLVNKWTAEGRLTAQQASLDAWFSSTGYPRAPRYYIIKWLTDLVRTYGVDGFRCDTAKNVDQPSWAALKTEAVKARAAWLAANPTKAALLVGDTNFWMTGEVYGHGVNRDSYFDNGFDSLINFNFMGSASNLSGIDSTYQSLDQVNKDGTWDMLSYISSHDIGLFDRTNLVTGLSALFMAPGGIEIFYGDETARPLMTNWAGTHAYRGDMNWSSINTTVYNHAKILGSFRNKHVAIGAGIHTQISSSPYTFERQQGSDTVVVAFGVSGTASISVGSAWANGTALRDYYTGATTTVANGTATVTAGSAGVVLLESAQ